MKNTLLFAFASLPLWAWASWKVFQDPIITVEVEEKVVQPEKVEACVSLTKWQVQKMLNYFSEDHPSEMQTFKTVVKREANGWRISSTHLAKGAEKYPLPNGSFFVIDASYIDHSGDFKSCINYAHSYKDNHEYIIVTSK